MKILIDARLYGLENAGLGRYINNLVSGLVKHDKKNNYVILLRKKYFESLCLPDNWTKRLTDFRHYSFSEQLLLPFIIARESPDLVHFPHFNIPIFYRGKFVVTIHDLLMHQQKGMSATTLSVPMYYLKRLGYGFVFKTAVLKSKAIFVPSQSVKNKLVDTYRQALNKTVITYEGVDDLSIKGTQNIPKPYFIYVGNAYPHKNLKKLIQSIVLLNKNYDQKVRLIIVSARNNFTQKLNKLINNLGAGKLVALLGYVEDTELGSLLVNSVGFVFPSLSEGFGLPGLEAMKTGTLLLASEIPVFKEIYKDNAIYFNQLDFNSIEKTMRDAIGMRKEEREMRIKKAQEFAKRYSWDTMARETLEIYEEAFKEKNSASLQQIPNKTA